MKLYPITPFSNEYSQNLAVVGRHKPQESLRTIDGSKESGNDLYSDRSIRKQRLRNFDKS